MHQVSNSDLKPVARKRVPKSVVLKMIESGRYTVRTLDGTPVTDFKRLFDDYEMTDTEKYITADQPQPVPVAQSAIEAAINRKRFSPRHTALVKIDDSEYTISQLEHFGDAVVSVSARVICHELFQRNIFHYFRHSAAMITNDNFRTSKEVKTAAQFEIILGDVFVRQGPEEAVKKGVELLKTTLAYTEALAEAQLLAHTAHVAEVKARKEESRHQHASEALDRDPIKNTIGDAFPVP